MSELVAPSFSCGLTFITLSGRSCSPTRYRTKELADAVKKWCKRVMQIGLRAEATKQSE